MTVEPNIGTSSKSCDVDRMLASQFREYTSPVSLSLDHSLAQDPRLYASSPSSQTMYELDLDSCYPTSSSLPSSCGEQVSDIGGLEEFDLKPQFECNISDLDLLKLDVGAAGTPETDWRPTQSPDIATNILKMEDVFQVDQSEAVHGPTLAELNGHDSTSIFGDIESIIGKDLSLHQSRSVAMESAVPLATPNASNMSTSVATEIATTTCHWKPTAAIPIPMARGGGSAHHPPNPFVTCTVTSPVATVPEILSQSFPGKAAPALFTHIGKLAALPEQSNIRLQSMSLPARPSHSTISGSLRHLLEEGQIKQENDVSSCVGSPTTAVPIPQCTIPVPNLQNLQTVPPSPRRVSNISQSAPTDPNIEQKWEEIKQFIYNDSQINLPPPTNVSSSPPKMPKVEPKAEVAFTVPEEQEAESNDEDSDSDVPISDPDNMTYDDAFWSDNESIDDFVEEVGGSGKKNTRFFWQYNTQSKGPKGKRLCKSFETEDPHILNDFEDPVFDPDLNQMQYKHNGKARRGDGNDITPSPTKLLSIGTELKGLNRTINDLTPVSELPVNVRPRSRKEKNKLASRACRLKKKAQHEANKVKLHGLDKEHQRLMTVLQSIKPELVNRMENRDADNDLMTVKLDRYIKKYLTHMIAGHTTEYVNSVLAKVKSGDTSGGIYD